MAQRRHNVHKEIHCEFFVEVIVNIVVKTTYFLLTNSFSEE